jgi:SpoVK/Ycf46/Vps4 family AAA+-type ATPase
MDRNGDAHAPAVKRIVESGADVAFLDSREPWPDLIRDSINLAATKPMAPEQHAAWLQVLGPAGSDVAARLAGQFNLDIASIVAIAADARAGAADNDAALPEALWTGCVDRTRPALDRLAQPIVPKATWDDLELAAPEKTLLRQIAAQAGLRSAVYDDWGFRARMNRGLGIAALFAGESGCGKTMAAEVIANALNLALYRIDLSAVVNKYIGETEKNLCRLFDAAEAGGAILFFDEADALFGKRGEVSSSHDRYANIEVDYLLQRVESYSGLAILATNKKSDVDGAFMRRMRFIVTFSFPALAERQAIWRKVFPPQVPVSGVDFARLAKLNLTGASIHNIALNAAFLAAEAGTAVTMPLLLDAARGELRKLDKPVNENDFRQLEAVGAKA